MEARWQDGSSQQEVLHRSLANAFLRQGHLTGVMLAPSWYYAFFNPKLSLNICTVQCVGST